MKKGDTVDCPHCGETTVVKIAVIMDGWTKVGEVFSCTLCGGELGPVEPAAAVVASPQEKADKLSALLGEAFDDSNKLKREEGDGVLCSNCRYFVVHPFQSRCSKHDRAADPMGDCPDFSGRMAASE